LNFKIQEAFYWGYVLQGMPVIPKRAILYLFDQKCLYFLRCFQLVLERFLLTQM